MRGRLHGTLQIVRYNWPLYAGAIIVILLSAGWYVWKGHGAALVVAGLAAAPVVTSLVASYWIYDHSPLYRWEWIPGALPFPPRRWLNLHAGLDESSDALRSGFPEAEGITADFFSADEMSEPSIYRARAESPQADPVDYRELPYSDGAFDAVFLLFAAHELRRPGSREAFFHEVTRVTAPGGLVLLVEHARDVANFIAFGPGFLHFQPYPEWRRIALISGLGVESERRMTPFVRILLLRKPE